MKSALLISLIYTMLAALAFSFVCGTMVDSSTLTPAPTSTAIQFPETDMDRTPLPPMTATPGIEFYVPMLTPVPFADMPLLYYPDDAHNADCWVTFNQMAISCLRRPAFWPCEARAER